MEYQSLSLPFSHYTCYEEEDAFFTCFFSLTVIPGPPLFSLTVQLLDPFPCCVKFIKDIQYEFLHTGRDCIEGNSPGTIRAAFVLWATQLDKVCVHSATSLLQGVRTE